MPQPRVQCRSPMHDCLGILTRSLQRPVQAASCVEYYNAWLCTLYRDVLVGCGVREPRDQAEPGFADPRSDAIEKSELPYRRKDSAFVKQLLHRSEERRVGKEC